MKVIIDRFEESYALVETPDRKLAVMPRQLLDPDAKEGDVVEIRIDREATEVRRKKALDFLDKLGGE